MLDIPAFSLNCKPAGQPADADEVCPELMDSSRIYVYENVN